MTKTTIIITSIIAMTFILLLTTSPAYAQVSNFFWSEDDGTAEIFAADSATKTVTQVTSGGFARIDDVEIDTTTSKLWWNNWATGPGNPDRPLEDIYNANLDGTAQARLFISNSCPGGGPPSGLTGLVLDPASSTVFYTRAVSYANCGSPSVGEVSSVMMDGTSQTELSGATAGGGSWHGDGIDLSGGTLYWGDPGVLIGRPALSPLNQMDTTGGSKVLFQLPHITGDGRSLVVDAANNLLFYSSHQPFGRGIGGEIFVVDLSVAPALRTSTNVLSDLGTGIPDIELDAANMRIYWTDYARGEIRSASYDATGTLGPIITEISNLDRPYGLALELQTTIPVEIDIKPGSDPSSVNCKNNKGNVPVAVFGSNTFDATTIDLASLELNEVQVTEVHNKLHIDDINNDGFDDAVLHLDKAGVCDATSNEVDYPLKASADATLTGSNADGDFEGIGDIRIVKR